jgi:RHS repeat-associated protein
MVYRRSDPAQIEALTYTYDAGGQRIAKTTGLGSAPETLFSATYDQANRMTSITFTGSAQTCTLTYDQNGNLATKSCPLSTTSYTWDAQDRLSALNAPGLAASFQYDALGRRIARTVNGQTTAYLYDGVQAIAETRAGQATTLLTGLEIDEMIAKYTNASQRTYLIDALGSVIGQAREDQSIQNWYRYSPYGETTTTANDEGNSSEYTARENDSTGLYYYRARYYDPVLKRFISEDPIGLAGGINTYAYVHGNPLSHTDPSGNIVRFVANLAWVAIQRAAGAAVFNIAPHYGEESIKGSVVASSCAVHQRIKRSDGRWYRANGASKWIALKWTSNEFLEKLADHDQSGGASWFNFLPEYGREQSVDLCFFANRKLRARLYSFISTCVDTVCACGKTSADSNTAS